MLKCKLENDIVFYFPLHTVRRIRIEGGKIVLSYDREGEIALQPILGFEVIDGSFSV